MDPESLGAEMALCRLAEQLVQPSSAEAAAAAFRAYDTDGSGYLEIGELCKALRSMREANLTSAETRLLLAYLFHYGDKDKDLRLSASELQSSLAPFVRRPPAEELQHACSAYQANRNLPALLRTLHRLQPAYLPAACAQAMSAAAAAAASGGGGAEQPPPGGAVPLALLPEILPLAAPGVEVPTKEVAWLRELVVLDSGAVALPMEELIAAISASADAVKRACAIKRIVEEARSERAPVAFESDLGSAEVVLQRLSDTLLEDEGERIAAAFAAIDRDGSCYLDGPELCAAMRQ
ncbi:hypothetical protein TSOC_001866, partial [Tetrabaena socialis]